MTTVFAIVLAEDWAGAKRCHCKECPVARAVARTLKTVIDRPIEVSVAGQITVSLLDTSVSYDLGVGFHGHAYFTMTMEQETLDFVNWWDHDGATYWADRPIVIPIDIPEDLPPPSRRLVP